MQDFIYYAPTEVVFGKEAESKVAELVTKYGGHKVLVHYGGKSAKASGLLDTICGYLKQGGVEFVELGGVVPNPRLGLVKEGIKMVREQKVDFILAIGGGSVIDSGKAIAMGANYDGDVWDFFEGTAQPKNCLPVASVLTLPAAGSEMSDALVITKEDGEIKRGYGNPLLRPKFAIMNPERTFTLPAYQTAAGVTDMMMHTMERFFSHDNDMALTDNIAISLLRTMKECVHYVLKDPNDYEHRAQIMWGGSLAHNGLTGCGILGDWATHQIEHELSALFDVAHGAGLAAVWPSWARYVMKENVQRFVQFAVEVWDVPNDYTDPEGTALRGIEEIEKFYHSIGMPTSIQELIGRKVTEDEIKEMARKCTRDNTITHGHFKVLKADDIEQIYRMAQ
jgi:alcohol dehydrogenase YqhD (iron-dependent ADH family)